MAVTKTLSADTEEYALALATLANQPVKVETVAEVQNKTKKKGDLQKDTTCSCANRQCKM